MSIAKNTYPLLAAVLIVAAANTAQAAFDQYTITDLGSIVADPNSPNNYSYAMDINDRGDIVGFSKGTDGLDHAFYRSRGGSITNLGLGRATSINNHRQLVGWQGGANYVMWKPNGSSFTSLNLGVAITTNPAYRGQIIKINEAGEVAGTKDTDAFFWKDGNLSFLGNWTCVPGSIVGFNNRGDVVHFNNFDTYGYEIYHSSNGTKEILPASIDFYIYYYVATNDIGESVGFQYSTTNAFYYSNNTGLREITTGDRGFWDINNAGLAVGGGGYPQYGAKVSGNQPFVGISGNENRAVVYSSVDNVWVFLDTLIPSSTWQKLYIATAINNAGKIVGVGINPQGKTHAFLLTPIAQP
jgi:probable HAF family extracellular repeat protein